MKSPIWLLVATVRALHTECLAAFGGSDGVRDVGLLESALARPLHLFTYERVDLCRLAAAYAHGIAKNHPFVDGNKRTAFLCATVFLERNGLHFAAPPAHAAVFVQALASGELDDEGFAKWLRDHTRKLRKSKPKPHRKRRRPGR